MSSSGYQQANDDDDDDEIQPEVAVYEDTTLDGPTSIKRLQEAGGTIVKKSVDGDTSRKIFVALHEIGQCLAVDF